MNGPLLIGELADALGVSQPGVTRNVGLLSKQGVVTVRRGKKDQRTKVVDLTAIISIVENGYEYLYRAESRR